jgi:hypothetical protein
MSQAEAENSCLSPKRPFGSFHLLRDHRYWRSSYRVPNELAQVFICPWGPMTSLFLCHYPMLP